jgi:hypothetical protein
MVVEGTVSPHSLLLQVHNSVPSIYAAIDGQEEEKFPFLFFSYRFIFPILKS